MPALLRSRAETRLTRLSAGLVVEMVAWAAVALGTGSLLWSRMNWTAAVCHLYVIGMVAGTIRELVAARSLDFADPVAVMQRKFEELRVWRIVRMKWGLLAGTVVWAPFLAALLGLGDGVWLFANAGFGIVLAGAILWVSRHWTSAHPLWRALSGESLAEAEKSLAQWRDGEHVS
jgi:hypothetical protein